MPTVTKTIYVFDEAFVEDGTSPWIHTIGTSPGGYSGHGYLEFTGPIEPGSDSESMTESPYVMRDWADMGVPSGNKVLSVRCTAFWVDVLGAPLIADAPPADPSYEEATWFTIVAEDGVTSVIVGDEHVNDGATPPTDAVEGNYVNYAENIERTVKDEYAAWDTSIRLQIGWRYSISGGTGSGSYERRIDQIDLTIDYEPLASSGGSGGGGDSGGGSSDGTEGWGGEETDGDCAEEDLLIGWPVQQSWAYANGWVHEGRYYLSVGSRTLCFDTAVKGWSDCGYGGVTAAHTVLMDGMPDMMFISRAQQSGASQPTYGTGVEIAHRMLDFRAPYTSAPWTRYVYYGPFDGADHDRKRRKRAIRLQIFGSFTHAYDGELPSQVGTLTMMSDTGRTESYPICPVRRKDYVPNSPHVEEAGVLYEQRFTRAMVGRVLHVKLEFTYECVILTQVMLEYTPLS